MEQVHVKESYSEILIFIDRNCGDRANALEEGVKILQRELIRAKINADPNRLPNSY